MAIIVKNINITPKSTEPVVDRSYEISVDEFGKVDVGKNGLDLGCQGDHNITKLEFNVNNLKYASKLSQYNPVLVFSRKNEDGTITNISCSGTNSVNSPISTFYIPEAVTTEAGDYSIVYTLREENEDTGNVNITNDTGGIKEKEVFVSNIFTGKVRSSIYADLVEVIKVENENKEKVPFTTDFLLKLFNKRTEDIKTADGIYKKKIALTWPEGKDEKITIKSDDSSDLSESEPSLGNRYDVFMTYMTIDHPFYHEESSKDNKDNEIFVVFISNDKDKVNYAVITMATTTTTDTGEKLAAVWVPAEVTISDRKKWKVGFVGLRENEKTGENEKTYLHASYSPAADFILNQNFLARDPEDDLDISQSAEVALMSSNGELQTKENDNSVSTLTVYDARNTAYSLGMTGKDVQERLNKVKELDAAMAGLQGNSATSIQGRISTAMETHNGSPDAHPNLVRAGTSDAKEYANYKGKNTIEGIVDVIRGEMTGRVGLTIKDVQDQISIHNQSNDGTHTQIVSKITTAKTELTTEINKVKDKETDLEAKFTSLKQEFDNFDGTYVTEIELKEKLKDKVWGFNPDDTKENETYGSYTIKTLKDESDTRLSDINADIAAIKVKAEQARTTANEANQTAANAYDAVTAIIQNKAEKTEVQLLNTKLDTEIAKNTREHEAINKKINDDISTAKIEIDGKITQAVEDAKYSLGLVDNDLQGQIDDVKERIQNLGSNESSINTRLSAAETDINALNIRINGLDNTYATDAALESVKSDLQALETKESQDITNLTNTINTLKGSDIGEDVTISSIDSKVNTVTSDLNTYKEEVNSSIANINTSIGELTSADEQLNTSLNSKLSKTTQIQSLGNVFNSEAEWEAFKASAEATTLYFVLEEE